MPAACAASGAGGSADQLRLSVALSGGASLGAYQAGALAALLVGVQSVRQQEGPRVAVNALGGASAGSVVALLGAHAVLEGLDPAAFLHEAWVERVSLDVLRRKAGQGVLSAAHLRQGLADFLTDDDRPAGTAGDGQQSPIGFHVSLTGLQGLTYPIKSLQGKETFTATTYSDWGRFVLSPDRGPEQILEPEGTSPLDYVLASAAHPGAFEPALLSRAEHAVTYRRNGIDDFPDSGYIWYTDGGLIQSQPLARLLAVARKADILAGDVGASRRALVLIDPRSEDPSDASTWTDPDGSPGWIHGLSRALEILPAQAAYDDAFDVEKMNSRLEWAARLVEALEPHLGEGAEVALRGFLTQVESDRAELPSEEEGADGRPHEATNSTLLGRLLHEAIAEVAGTVGKENVDVNVISPRLLVDANGGEVTTLLAGEFMGDFGGFLDRDVRQSDFLLGYASTEAWLPEGLHDTGFDRDVLAVMAENIAERRPGEWRKANRGHVRPRALGWRARLDFARLASDVVRALTSNVVNVPNLKVQARTRATNATRSLRSIARR